MSVPSRKPTSAMRQSSIPGSGENRAPMRWISSVVARLVHASTGRSRALVLLGGLIGVLSIVYVAIAFDMRADLDSLLSSRLPWRISASALEREFPSQGDDIVLVIDGDTPELADRAAGLLTQRLSENTQLFTSVKRANGGPFFDREGLLFMTLPETQKTTSALIAAQPLLGPLAADPTLRGLMTSIVTGVSSARDDPHSLALLDRPIRMIADTLLQSEAGRPAHLSWRGVITGEAQAPKDWRQFVDILPKLDYTEMMPAARHTKVVRDAIADLRLTPANGVRVRITGSAPVADDELATLGESVGPIGMLMLASMLAILFLAVRSPRMVFSIMVTVLVGAAITSALGLLVFQRFNLISVAFLPLFVGLGIDFAIQFSVRAKAELAEVTNPRHALTNTASIVGGGLALAAVATAAGFLAFLPTEYRGVSELGLIAGLGMVVALLLTITLLPALLALLGVDGGGAETGFNALHSADAWILRRRRAILGGSCTVALFAAAALPLLQFNFDPMTLRSEKNESMSTYLELARTPETTPNTLNLMTSDLSSARPLAHRLAALPEVALVLTLHDFVPKDQESKLAAIQDAQMLLDLTLNPFDATSPPSDAEIVSKIGDAVHALRDAALLAPRYAVPMGRLADALDRLAQASMGDRARAHEALLGGFPTALNQINAALSAEPVSLDTIPEEVRSDWVAPSGRARIEIFPRRQLLTTKDTANFVTAVRRVGPDPVGDPVTIVESGKTILGAFVQAGTLSTIAIIVLLVLALRSAFWTAMAAIPVVLSGVLTFASCIALGQVINLENMIALPLLLGIGVAFNIYFIVARRAGTKNLLQSSLARAVVFSALTTGTAFASLALSAHPGTASMGVLLLIALFWILVTTLLVLPALMSVCLDRGPRSMG